MPCCVILIYYAKVASSMGYPSKSITFQENPDCGDPFPSKRLIFYSKISGYFRSDIIK
jgi:hypothetical protein